MQREKEDRPAQRLHRPLLRRYHAPRRSTRARRKSSALPPASSPVPTSPRPFIALQNGSVPSGKNRPASSKTSTRATPSPTAKPRHVIRRLLRPPFDRGAKVILMGRNGQGKTTLLKALLANGPGIEEKDVSIDSGSRQVGTRSLDRLLRPGPQRLHPDWA